MAKRTRQVKADESAPAGTQLAAAAESKLEAFAEDLGRLLGRAQAKAKGWLDQRQSIAAQLTEIRDTAQTLLAELTGGSAEARRARKRGPGRPPGSGKRKRTMSAEAREKIAAAQRARWARQKRAKPE